MAKADRAGSATGAGRTGAGRRDRDEKPTKTTTSGRVTASPKTKSERTRPEALEKKPSVRERVSRTMLRVGFIRRRYIKRMLRYIDKSKEKGRRLPPELFDLSRMLSQVPKEQRAERLEEVITAQQAGFTVGNRDLRRAQDNQARQSGRGGNRYRPGMPPRSMVPGPRPPKRPR